MDPGVHSPEDRRFVGLAAGVIDDILVRDPVHATEVGDHRFDTRLPDLTADGADEFARVLQRHQQFLDRIEDRALSRFAAADLAILRQGVARRIFDLTLLRRNEWDPLVWDPAPAMYALTTREFAPAPVRARALVERLRGVGEFLENARHTLQAMPPVNVATAVARLRQFAPMLTETLGPLAEQRGVTDAVDVAVTAVARQIDWLADTDPLDARPQALGPELFEGVLTHHLDADLDVDELLAAAEDDLDRTLDELASVAARFRRGTMADRSVVSAAFEEMADDAGTPDTVLDLADAALRAAADFVSARNLMTVPALDIRLEVMPPVRRGSAIAYCDAPGALERADLPTVIALSPAPDDWDPHRRDSFHREYNRHMMFDLMVHEAVPGHALQLARARAVAAPTDVRAVMPSGLFIEGWAVYAEELMAHRGFYVDPDRRLSLRLQQLKMQLRVITNTILDIRVHTRGMTEPEARRLMATKGFAEDGEIVGKWDRARLTAGQLSEYYVGYRGVAQIVDDLDTHHRDWDLRQVHDAVLAQGSVSPRILRSLVGLE